MIEFDAKYITKLCLDEGFASAGVTQATPTQYTPEFLSWIEEDQHGEMGWLANNIEVRLNPTELVANAKSIICVADRYAIFEEDSHHQGKVARYARGKDYHKVMKKRLRSICDVLSSQCEHVFRACVDTAPLLEREYAARAGLGAMGKHTLLIEQGVGSWLLLGAIVTTADIEITATPQLDPCGTCTNCIDACPTDAIKPWSVDATKCISYLTIEHRTKIDSKYFDSMGQWVFGCDICQEVCPHNQQTTRSSANPIHDAYQERFQSLDVLEVLNWSEEDRRQMFQGSSMKRAKLDMIRRNAIIVAGNLLHSEQGDKLLNVMKAIAEDQTEDDLVRETAIEVLKTRCG